MMKQLIVSGVLVLGGLAFVGCDEKSTEKAADTAGKAAHDAVKATGDATRKAGEAIKDTSQKAGEAIKDAAVKTGDAAKGLVDKAKAAVSDESGKVMSTYTSEIQNANSVLAKITNVESAKAELMDLTKSVASVNAAAAAVDKLATDVRSAWMSSDHKTTYDSAVATFKANVDRLSKDSAINAVVGDTIKQFKIAG